MSPGRPPLPPERRRTIRKGVSFSDEEYDRLCLTALRLRMDVNQFIRLMSIPDVVVGRGYERVSNEDGEVVFREIVFPLPHKY